MIGEPPRVEVAMATFNGARYLPEMLASIAAQDWPTLAIVASDDGSKDATLEVLRSLHDIPIRMIENPGPHGIIENFAHAVAATTAPYVALCDQDDVWRADKVTRLMAAMQAIEAEHGTARPALVFSDLELVDGALQTIAPSYFAQGDVDRQARTLADFALVNHVPGCAMLANRALIDRAFPLPPGFHIHDWWMVLVATTTGTIGAVDAPLIRYRQHGGNNIGIFAQPPTLWARLRRKLASPLGYISSRRDFYRQSAHVTRATLTALEARVGPELSAEDRALLDGLLRGSFSRRRRVMAGARTGLSRANRLGTLFYL
ncbi:glycosyltransferase family 2 protein [Sphingomonas sp. BIUV-7]|uniref:Glycosyltransferase family 2 protein n=1 Tax=Sphingomonas natans TaxID=3063330 RepID=A0ABT8Y5U3_9SPHN|nr:glycosyltransferase family 2 protein [Sphingomonas sp. BIUV-7]MDO6413367.1 glycosyltransferase family 2 protein [Sphingomonas sp. BIUV-7]